MNGLIVNRKTSNYWLKTEALNQIDSNVPALTQLSDRTSDRLQSLVDQTFWRLVQLVLVLVGATVVGALGYRVVARRWNQSPPG